MKRQKSGTGVPPQELVEDEVRRILTVLQPRRIILFGSAARGNMGPNSDLDIMIVMPDGVHRRKTAQSASRALFDLGIPKDIVVVTEGDIQKFGADPSLVIAPALSEGREIYHA